MKDLEILGSVLALLGSYTRKEFEAAAKNIRGTHVLRECLQVLGHARRTLTEQARGRASLYLELVVRMPAESSRLPNRYENALDDSVTSQLSKLLSDTKLFQSNADLCSFLNKSVPGIAFRPKDSRAQTLRKLFNFFRRAEERERRFALRRILRRLPDSETAGWFDAIRGE